MENINDFDAIEAGFESNKSVVFKQLDSIYIEKFRSIQDKFLHLGKNITLISGKNGTMKSSILGLIAHPFSSPNDATDVYGNDLKTKMEDVFRLSLEKDIDRYRYYLNATGLIQADEMNEIKFSEQIRVYLREKESRHRVTVGKDNRKGRGNFLLNTCYINLKRLFPIIETEASEISNKKLTPDFFNFIHKGYYTILQNESFRDAALISDEKSKHTFGPKDKYYDYNTISSGEDNLGNILLKMWAFEENKIERNGLQGIFCIDEIEAGLHPVAQERLFNFLLDWSQKNNIQIVATTHSLYLIQHALTKQNESRYKNNEIQINIISKIYTNNNNYNIISNPSYNLAYKELTFKDLHELEDIYKIHILCEDSVACYFLKRILQNKEIVNRLNFMYGITNDENNPGTSYKSLISIVKNGAKLLNDSIVVFDADVPAEKIKQIKNSNVSFLKLNVIYDLPLEKAIVKYIYDLPGDDSFFIKNKKEKDSFISEFSDFRIFNLNEIERLKGDDTTKYKNWCNKDKRKFNTYITAYTKHHNDELEEFRACFVSMINKKLIDRSLPIFE